MPQHFTNPVVSDDRGADHGDPFVLRHRDEYFLYHTTDDGDRGISVHRSRDLVHWSFAAIALLPGGWAQTDVWAPEVVNAGGPRPCARVRAGPGDEQLLPGDPARRHRAR
ncbi:MAG: family 43 glycosylhydrolase, partial [Solirubrobacterales bacterium]|nr:family 43 glycosylhydrolase [Solirubrobacterales bacterium]